MEALAWHRHLFADRGGLVLGYLANRSLRLAPDAAVLSDGPSWERLDWSTALPAADSWYSSPTGATAPWDVPEGRWAVTADIRWTTVNVSVGTRTSSVAKAWPAHATIARVVGCLCAYLQDHADARPGLADRTRQEALLRALADVTDAHPMTGWSPGRRYGSGYRFDIARIVDTAARRTGHASYGGVLVQTEHPPTVSLLADAIVESLPLWERSSKVVRFAERHAADVLDRPAWPFSVLAST